MRAKITSDRTHDADYYSVTPYLDSHGTTHVSVIAEDGMAVSVTSTINYMYVLISLMQEIPVKQLILKLFTFYLKSLLEQSKEVWRIF